eukprot:TRINITY_DN6010_c1_g1_i2.p1 TRINITY_DN6010_c1_g1~~TRINITY_DN6010_c1_g1_i2.p1  ORF type:complete len:617 (+),score=75.73 TRINITY_DN6010_c1_g1_i2:107-1957(+)
MFHPGMHPGGGMGYGGGRSAADPFRCGRDYVLGGRYRVLDEAGKGNFARVMRAVDTNTNETVAVKILAREYQRDAQFEHSVLKALSKKDPDNRAKVSKMANHFVQDGCPCFVFPLLGCTLKSRRRSAGRKEVAALALELAKALRFLHFECKLVHTDLKPENILLDQPNSSPQGIGDSWTIVDFGSASFFTEKPDQDLISTRPYRAPEVIVGGAWGYAADMWSVACILFEVLTGRHLFDAANDHQHLQVIQRTIGGVPSFLRDHAAPQQQQMFGSDGSLRPSVGMGPPTPLQGQLGDDVEFLDLMHRLLEYDPVMRLRADEMCHHPFCTLAKSNTRRCSEGSEASDGRRGQSASPRDVRILSQSELPPSLYTSGRIRTPGVAHLASGGSRPPADRLLERGATQGVTPRPAQRREEFDDRQARRTSGASAGYPGLDPGYGLGAQAYGHFDRRPPAPSQYQHHPGHYGAAYRGAPPAHHADPDAHRYERRHSADVLTRPLESPVAPPQYPPSHHGLDPRRQAYGSAAQLNGYSSSLLRPSAYSRSLTPEYGLPQAYSKQVSGTAPQHSHHGLAYAPARAGERYQMPPPPPGYAPSRRMSEQATAVTTHRRSSGMMGAVR